MQIIVFKDLKNKFLLIMLFGLLLILMKLYILWGLVYFMFETLDYHSLMKLSPKIQVYSSETPTPRILYTFLMSIFFCYDFSWKY